MFFKKNSAKKLFLSFCLPLLVSQAYSLDKIDKKALKKKAAQTRVVFWDRYIKETKNKKLSYKLLKTNHFWNAYKYKKDKDVWKKKDYWTTPLEFLVAGGGDCEDYAIGKYYSLKKLGIPDYKLRFIYGSVKVKNKKERDVHMVLSYWKDKDSDPLILDNINKKILPLSKRKDFKPIYSFNKYALWKSRFKGTYFKKMGKNNMKKWKSLKIRMEKAPLST